MSKATAIYLAREGAKVLAWDLGVDVEGKPLASNPVDETVAQIKEEGNEAIAFHGDVSNMADAEKAIGTAIDTYGKLDILCCIAGILRERMVFNMTEEEWDDVLRVHAKGTFAPTKFAAVHWRQRREYGRLIAFTSGAWLGSAGQINYGSAKAAIVGFIRSTSSELVRYGVTANAIAPSAATRMNDRSLAQQEAVRDGAPTPSSLAIGTNRDPMNLPPLITYLASEAGGNVTGKVFAGDGWHYALYSDPVMEKHLWTDKPWDIDDLFSKFRENLGGGLKEIEGRSAAEVTAAGRERVAAEIAKGQAQNA
jgi:NAD(P)-dependent dehydrogenase (short-subunit alcohol dehydrogenase family)